MTKLHDLKIPHSGSVENAKLIEWRIAEGAAFREGDILYEIETDKVATEVEAVEPGILARRLSAEGDEHKVGDRIGLWASPGTTASAIAEALSAFDATPAEAPGGPQASAPSPAPTTSSPAPAGERISPLVRRLAKEYGVDLDDVTGSGPGGRITGEDVLAAAGQGKSGTSDAYDALPVTRLPHSLRRKTIARRMTEAAAAPTLTADMEVDLSKLLAKRDAARTDGKPPSVLAYVAHAVAVLLMGKHQALNATYTEDAALRWGTVNLGIAIDTEDGLVVPVIRDAQTLDPAALAERIADLATRARANSLAASELDGGTFTLSNPGSLGPVIRAEAILNTPQVALLGLPGLIHAPVAVKAGDGWAVEVRPLVRASLTFDHRALDGGPVIAFLNDLKAELER